MDFVGESASRSKNSCYLEVAVNKLLRSQRQLMDLGAQYYLEKSSSFCKLKRQTLSLE